MVGITNPTVLDFKMFSHSVAMVKKTNIAKALRCSSLYSIGPLLGLYYVEDHEGVDGSCKGC